MTAIPLGIGIPGGLAGLLALAFALGTDAFTVAVAVGLRGVSFKDASRLTAGFGLLQFGMPLAGIVAGSAASSLIGRYAGWVGGLVLIGLGLSTLAASRKPTEQGPRGRRLPPTYSLWNVLGLSMAVSLDALSVGFGIGVTGKAFIPASVVIGITAALMTALGLRLGGAVGGLVARPASLIGGLILLAIGVSLIIT